MIGKYQISLDSSDFVRGLSTSDNLADGGFSPNTDQVNLIATPGVIHQPNTSTDKSTNLTGNPIASCSSVSSTYPRFIIASDGKVMGMDASDALTASAALTGTFTEGTTDIVQFFNYIFITTTTDVARMNTDLTGGDSTWWSATATGTGSPFGILTSGVRHPMVVYQDYIWVGDNNSLHQITSGTTGVKGKLVLGGSYNITALGVDQGTGYMLIGVSIGLDYSATTPADNYIMLYDGIQNQPIRTVAVDGTVTAFQNSAGVTYVTYGDKLGYWNGSGVSFLRKLNNVTLTGNELAYKHHITSIDNTLYVIDGSVLLAYGEVLPGQKVFYPAYKNAPSGTITKVKMICEATSKKIGFGYATNKFYTLDVRSATVAGTMSVYFNKIKFPRPVYIRSAYIEWSNAVSNNVTPGTLRVLDETGTESLFSSLQNTSGASSYFIETKSMNRKVRTAQIRYVADTVVAGVNRIVVNYDIAE